MKIYLAGTCVAKPENCPDLVALFSKCHKLHSYFHVVNGFETRWFDVLAANKVPILLDSGAYSAYTKGEIIDLSAYADFLFSMQDKGYNIEHFANLDVIGDPEKTMQNHQWLCQQGLEPMPVYHYGEPVEYLQAYLECGSHVALGGLMQGTRQQLLQWMDFLFDRYLTDAEGKAIVKVHGFGLTSATFLFRYPWYSVDSSSWVMTGAMGGVLIPVFNSRTQTWNWHTDPSKVDVSAKSPARKKAGAHVQTLSPMVRHLVDNYISMLGYSLGESEIRTVEEGYTLQENESFFNGKKEVEKILKRGLSNTYVLRDEFNIQYYLQLQDYISSQDIRFQRRLMGGFNL